MKDIEDMMNSRVFMSKVKMALRLLAELMEEGGYPTEMESEFVKSGVTYVLNLRIKDSEDGH